MLSLILAAIFFAGLHLGIAGTRLRDRAVTALGAGPYRAVFSVASALCLIWLAVAYKHAPLIVTWGTPGWWKPVAIILMIPAFILAVTGLRTPNPTAVGMESLAARSPEGIVKVTRHPLLMGIGLWALVHLVANGDVASFIFFGTLAINALAGTVRLDAKRRAGLGPWGESLLRRRLSFPSPPSLRAGRALCLPKSRPGDGRPPLSFIFCCFSATLIFLAYRLDR